MSLKVSACVFALVLIVSPIVTLCRQDVDVIPGRKSQKQNGPQTKKKGTPPAPSKLGRMLPLRTYEFNLVRLDSTGAFKELHKGQAQYFSEAIRGVPLDMVKLPGGTFLMGSPTNEEGHEDNEEPQHMVSVPTFYLGKYEVTQAQWQAVAKLPKVKRALNPDPSYFKGDDLPVERVSWEDAVEFCERLRKVTGRQYRLPDEAEWEYACRAGTTTPFAFGYTIKPELVNYDGQHPYGWAAPEPGIYRKKTTPVGYMAVANAFGLYDMHGNVWEWCQNPWHDDYTNAPTDTRNASPENAWGRSGDPHKRVLRGGSWYSPGDLTRSARRYYFSPDFVIYDVGFRVACTAPK
ncbi:MAG TPA: formylglycine-generating enzyme family protein [Blastocatellia bacterium]|nr:formylglycine-generating enzyme family protein [Blastocatellia bacterium]